VPSQKKKKKKNESQKRELAWISQAGSAIRSFADWLCIFASIQSFRGISIYRDSVTARSRTPFGRSTARTSNAERERSEADDLRGFAYGNGYVKLGR